MKAPIQEKQRRFKEKSEAPVQGTAQGASGNKNGASGNSWVPASGKFQGRRFKNKFADSGKFWHPDSEKTHEPDSGETTSAPATTMLGCSDAVLFESKTPN